MKSKLVLKIVSFLVISLYSFISVADEKLLFVTEEFPPYNYAFDNQLKGLSMDVVSEMINRVADYKVEVELLPWLRAYHQAKTDKNTAIFSVGRNAERENLFHWVGIIAPAKFYMFALKDREDIVLESLEDAKKYSTGTFPKSVREQYLIENGFVLNENLHSIYSHERLFEMLDINRIDLWPTNEILAHHIVRERGLNPEDTLKKALFLKDLSPGGYYLAFNKKTDISIVEKYAAVLEDMKEDGTYQGIISGYGIE